MVHSLYFKADANFGSHLRFIQYAREHEPNLLPALPEVHRIRPIIAYCKFTIIQKFDVLKWCNEYGDESSYLAFLDALSKDLQDQYWYRWSFLSKIRPGCKEIPEANNLCLKVAEE